VRLLIALFLLLGCGGIHTVSAQTPEWVLRPGGLAIGGHADDDRYTLSRVVGAQRLADGRVVIADRFAHGLRMYTSAGEYLARAGAEGPGPEEFQAIRGLGRCEQDHIVAFDLGWVARVYDQELQFLGPRRIDVPELSSGAYQLACAPSGVFLVSGWGSVAEGTVGLYEATAPVLLLRGDTIIHHFGSRLSSERVGVATDGDGSADPHYSGGASGPHPLGRQMAMAVGPDRVYLGDGTDYSVEVFDLSGSPLEPIRWTGPNLRISDEDMRAFEANRVAGLSERQKPAMRRAIQELPRLENFPAYDKLMVGQGRRLWVRSFLRPRDEDRAWWVFGEQSSMLAVVRLPRSMRLLEAGSDYVLVVERDSLGVETVRLMFLEGPGVG